MNLKINIIANFLGRGWLGIVNLIFVPFYIKFLGMEAYGLIGIYITLLGLLAVLDLGLSTTLNRTMAQHTATELEANQLHNLVRSFEIAYWCIGATMGVAIFFGAPWLADHWINQQAIPKQTVVNALRLMGGVIVFQWPSALYAGGLMGLQRQVLLNAIRSGVATLQSGGAVLVLWLISPTIQAFFIWQLFAYALQSWLMAKYLSKSLPFASGHRTRFETKWLLHNWQFSAGTMGITLLATMLTQLDKIIISKYFSLTIFGYYTLAFMVSNALSSFASPIFSAVFPRFSQLFAEDNNKELAALYHKSCQLMSLLIVPAGIYLVIFSEQILALWVGNPEVVNNVSPLLRVIILGTIANSIMLLPLALQLASGWTKLSFYKNLIAIVLYVPMLLGLVSKYGVMGAAISWVILNLCYVLFEPMAMHSRILKLEMFKWYWLDLGVPIIVTVGIAAISNVLFIHASWLLSLAVNLLTVWLILTLIFFSNNRISIAIRRMEPKKYNQL